MLKTLMKKILNNKRPHRFVDSGFTLAEVLITLGIIGVVAAMTIPNLIANYQKTQTVTQLKKAYSTLSQVFENSTKDNGFPDTWDWSLSEKDFVKTYIIPYGLAIEKDCGVNATDNCKETTKNTLRGTPEWYSTAGTYNIILDDGTQIFFCLSGSSFLDIEVDINGDKKPNTLGKDVFLMRISHVNFGLSSYTPYKIFFIDPGKERNSLINNATSGCDKTAERGGEYCGALIQYDGWKISDDYPWN